MANFIELDAEFQRLTANLDFDFVYPTEMLPASQDEIARALIEFLRFSLKANSKTEGCERLNFMALENARFSFQKLAMFSVDIKSMTPIKDVPVSTGIRIADLSDQYAQLIEIEKKNLLNPDSSAINQPFEPIRSTDQYKDQGISFSSYLIGIVILIGLCLILREFNY